MSEIPKIEFEQKLVARDDMPLLGEKILFTSPRHYAGNLASLLVERGARPIWMPTIAIYPVDDYTEFDRALIHLDEYAWVGITSIMGSQAFVNRIKALGLDAAAAKKAKIAAFRQDSIPLSQLGIEADLIPAVNYPSTMIEEIEQLGPRGGKVLVPVPEVHGVAEPFVIPEFISELERIGMVPQRIAVYATHATTERFTRNTSVSGQPVVLDNVTGLQWQGCAGGTTGDACAAGDAAKYDWDAALAYCDSLSWSGYSNWRLPDELELDSLVDFSRTYPSIDITAFPGTLRTFFWSSSSYVTKEFNAWRVNFDVGGMDYLGHKLYTYRARCVRIGP